ncbi:alpha/beta fold hydrolase [Mesorhizobium sp. IMUNJ 23232]|uniref:alpha/beta fold hydrolase n=1 Tax=Mesorhizobium sp. IMUNJ 23232 TaxID=3376064 RepID=UPI0037AD1FAA
MTTVSVGTAVAEVSGEGFPLVMIHGLGGTSNMFFPQMQALSGFRVVRVDLPGSGRSPRPVDALSIEGMAQAVLKVMEATGVEKAHVVGHSMGTIVAQQIAAERPEAVASLVLFGALAEPAEATRNGLQARAKLARSGGMSDIADQIVANAISAHTREHFPAAAAFVRESITRQDFESYARTCEALAKAQAIDAKRIKAPALLITGDADTVNPPSVAQALADRIKGAVFSSLDRSGHWATVEAPGECSRRLADFLARVHR